MDRANKISMAESILDYTFENKDLLWEALQAPGSNVVRLNGHLLSQGNKGLASLGDAVATLVIKLDCYTTNRSVGRYCLALSCTILDEQSLFSLSIKQAIPLQFCRGR